MFFQAVYLIIFVARVTFLLACNSHRNGESELLSMQTMPPVYTPLNASDILRDLFLNYDKNLRPGYAGEALNIVVSLGVLSISNIQAENMEFTVDMYMRQIWNDTRLAFDNRGSALVLQQETLDNLWLPDTYFANAVKTFVQQETRTVVLFGDGLIIYSQRVTVTATTLMNFRAYPMDKQVFRLDIMSYGRDNNQLRYRRIDAQLLNKEMSEFVIVNQSLEITAKELFMGCFDMMTVMFTGKRRIGYYVIRVYFPCTLCTVVSWMAFWMDYRNIGDRGTVGITSLLTQLFLVESINESMPHVSYMKAADLFLIVSFAFTFIALLESVIVYKAASRGRSAKKVSPQNKSQNETDRQTGEENQKENTCENAVEMKNMISTLHQQTDRNDILEVFVADIHMEARIDKISRMFFPCGYMAFMIGYFVIYMV